MIEIPTPRGLLKISTDELGKFNSVYIILYTDKGEKLPILQLEIPEPEVDYIQCRTSWRMPVPKGEPRIYLYGRYEDEATHLVTVGPDEVRIACETNELPPEVIG